MRQYHAGAKVDSSQTWSLGKIRDDPHIVGNFSHDWTRSSASPPATEGALVKMVAVSFADGMWCEDIQVRGVTTIGWWLERTVSIISCADSTHVHVQLCLS